MNKRVKSILKYLLSIHILALVVLSAFRLALYYSNIHHADGVENSSELLLGAMTKGLLFDNAIACYILALPLVLLFILSFWGNKYKGGIRFSNIYFCLVYYIVFSLSAGDIPYFSYFFGHIGVSALEWIKYGDTFGMMFQESAYYPYIIGFFVIYFTFCIFVFCCGRKANKTERRFGFGGYRDTNISRCGYIPLYMLLAGLCFVGIRGSLGQLPLRLSHAYFCDVPFFNQLGINPTFNLIKSYSLNSKKYNDIQHIESSQKAIEWVRQAMNIESDSTLINPLSRRIQPHGDSLPANVVLVLMESMSDVYMNYTDANGKTLTPYLHQLMDEGYYFDNFYSTGTHTNNGIVGSLYGYPSLLNKPMMGLTTVDQYLGLPAILEQNGYHNLFFVGGNPHYDGMQAFLLQNNINRLYSIDDYPSNKIANSFGPQDDYLLEFAINILNEKSAENTPFFTTFLTVSNHAPLIIPDRFKNVGDGKYDAILAFVDYSIQNFMEKARKEAWYDNTIFVFVGDHGRVLGKQSYEMPLSYHHVPLIIYSPLLSNMPQRISKMGVQSDIYPTIMGMLNMSYINNSMGIDLLKDERPFAYFTSDTHLGCIQDEFFYMYNATTNTQALYRYRNMDTEDYSDRYTALRDSMRQYSFAMMTTAKHIIENKLTDKE